MYNMSYPISVNIRPSDQSNFAHQNFKAENHDDSDSAEDDHSFYLPRPTTVSCYGLPYLDHTYGAPLPPSPPPISPAPVPRINGHIDIDNVSYHAEVTTTPVDPDNQYADSVTRCICGFLHDDGYMICCDKCGVWQHVDCMGVEREHIPEVYFCEQCQPRFVDKRKAIQIQRKRYELLTAVDVETTDYNDESLPLPLTRDLTSLTPIRTLPRGPKSQPKRLKILKRSLSLSSGLKQLHKTKFHRLPRKSVCSTSSVNSKLSARHGGNKCIAEGCNDNHYHSRYEEDDIDVAELPGHRNTYNSEVISLLRRQQRLNGSQSGQPNMAELLLPMRDQLCRLIYIGPNVKGLQVLDDVETGRPLIEYTGSVKIDEDLEDDASSPRRLQPFVLIYSKFDGVRLRIEATSTDSDARYIRRSCKPNSEVRHVCERSTLRFFIFSSRSIFKGQEVTIPYDMEYSELDNFTCGCGRVPCPAMKSVRRFSRLGRRKKSEREGTELSVDINGDEANSVSPSASLTSLTVVQPANSRKKRQDSVLEENEEKSPKNENNSTVSVVSKRRQSEEAISAEIVPQMGRRRKKSICQPQNEVANEEVAIKQEECRTPIKIEKELKVKKREDKEEKKSITVDKEDKKLKVAEKDEKKPKVTLEHSVSCTSPKDGTFDDAFGDCKKMSREERKLEAIMKAFERLEKQSTKRRDSVSKSDTKPDKPEIKIEVNVEDEVEVNCKKDLVRKKPGPKKLKGRKSWLALKRGNRSNSNISSRSQSSSNSVDDVPIAVVSASVPNTPSVDITISTPAIGNVPFKFPKTKKAMMSEWLQEKSNGDQRSLEEYHKSLSVHVDTSDDDVKYVNYVQTSTRGDSLRNIRRTSSSSGSSKGSPASLHQLQQVEFTGGSAKKRWLRQVMHEKTDADHVNGPMSPGEAVVSLASPCMSPSAELVAPLKKRRVARESSSEEAATLLSLANSVPAMEYEELEKGRTGGICGDIMASNACLNLSASLGSDMADNLFEKFSAQRHLSLAEQLLSLKAGGHPESRSSEMNIHPKSSTILNEVVPDEKTDGLRLLVEGIEQAAARERANSLSTSTSVDPCTSASLITPAVNPLTNPISINGHSLATVPEEISHAFDDDSSVSCDSSALPLHLVDVRTSKTQPLQAAPNDSLTSEADSLQFSVNATVEDGETVEVGSSVEATQHFRDGICGLPHSTFDNGELQSSQLVPVDDNEVSSDGFHSGNDICIQIGLDSSSVTNRETAMVVVESIQETVSCSQHETEEESTSHCSAMFVSADNAAHSVEIVEREDGELSDAEGDEVDQDGPVSSSHHGSFGKHIVLVDIDSNSGVQREDTVTSRNDDQIGNLVCTEDDDVSSSGSTSAILTSPECSAAVSSSSSNIQLERKKVSLHEYRSRMRERSTSTQSRTPALLSPVPVVINTPPVVVTANDTVSVFDVAFAAIGNNREKRDGEDVRWNAEATAAERVREQGHLSLTERLRKEFGVDASDDENDHNYDVVDESNVDSVPPPPPAKSFTGSANVSLNSPPIQFNTAALNIVQSSHNNQSSSQQIPSSDYLLTGGSCPKQQAPLNVSVNSSLVCNSALQASHLPISPSSAKPVTGSLHQSVVSPVVPMHYGSSHQQMYGQFPAILSPRVPPPQILAADSLPPYMPGVLSAQSLVHEAAFTQPLPHTFQINGGIHDGLGAVPSLMSLALQQPVKENGSSRQVSSSNSGPAGLVRPLGHARPYLQDHCAPSSSQSWKR